MRKTTASRTDAGIPTSSDAACGVEHEAGLRLPKSIPEPGRSPNAPPHHRHMQSAQRQGGRYEATVPGQIVGRVQAPRAESGYKIDLLELQRIEPGTNRCGIDGRLRQWKRNGCQISGAGDRMRNSRIDLQ